MHRDDAKEENNYDPSLRA